VPVKAVGACRVGTSLWRHAGQVYLTTIAKAAFAVVPGGVMAAAETEPSRTADGLDRTQPSGSLTGVRETWPPLRQADVLLFGHAYPPPGQPTVGQRRVRLEVGRGDQSLLRRPALVVGDRRSGVDPTPFDRMPLGWEQALGGVGSSDNPLGTGRGASSDRLPNVVCVEDPTGTAVCFGPVPATFPARRAFLGATEPRQLDGARDYTELCTESGHRIDGGVLELAADMAFADRQQAISALVMRAVVRLRDLGLLAPPREAP
jgi:hypothetical protein